MAVRLKRGRQKSAKLHANRSRRFETACNARNQIRILRYSSSFVDEWHVRLTSRNKFDTNLLEWDWAVFRGRVVSKSIGPPHKPSGIPEVIGADRRFGEHGAWAFSNSPLINSSLLSCSHMIFEIADAQTCTVIIHYKLLHNCVNFMGRSVYVSKQNYNYRSRPSMFACV